MDDPITDILRQGVRCLLARVLEAEIELCMNQYAELKDEYGRRRIVHHSFMPQREIQPGIGSVPGTPVGYAIYFFA